MNSSKVVVVKIAKTNGVTIIAMDASLSQEYVTYAENEGPLDPFGLYALFVLTTIFETFPYCPKYSFFIKI